MKKLIALPLLCLYLSLNAQETEKPKKTFEPADIYHGVIYGTNRPDYDNFLGYHLDMHMRKRLWLFTDYSLYATRYNYAQNRHWGFEVNTTASFAFRFNKEDARFTYYPYVGFSLSPVFLERNDISWANQNHVPATQFELNFQTAFMFGFEVKARLSPKCHLGLGIRAESNRGFLGTLKFGWNRPYKHK